MESCKDTLLIRHADSPWLDYTKNFDEEKAAQRISADDMEASFLPPTRLSGFSVPDGPLLAVDAAKRRVKANARYFSELTRPDATRLAKGQSLEIGAFKDLTFTALSPMRLAFFLVESQIIQTYAHIESTLCFTHGEENETFYTAHFKGSHVYFTNARHVKAVAFAVIIDKKTGLMSVKGE